MEVEAALAEFMVSRGWVYDLIDNEWIVRGPDGNGITLAAVDANAAWAALTYGSHPPKNGQIICLEGCAYCYALSKQKRDDVVRAGMLLEATTSRKE